MVEGVKVRLEEESQEEVEEKVGKINDEVVDMTDQIFLDLNIIIQQEHPSLMIQNLMPKEGFSLFSLFDFTVLQKGRAYLKYLFQTPLKNLNLIKLRQTSILMLAKIDRAYTVSPCFYADLQKILSGYRDLEIIIKRWEKARIFDTKGVQDLMKSL